uniref:Major facilitator superfamily (MFS) profile domain-containing protein n=1 Tax=Kwoniella dejecticola CBS 10117 TaxID=1296121 RepID=A0A1A6AB27_9TREE|nr:uncharacterized protein I303_03284 [Kwoniella dejecticola CBS 10117]OBR87259.1 hypothetical protein I303_03284 [Kwoniella dejecticola CBS 10117]
MSVKAGWKQTTPFLVFCVIAYAWGDLMFGIDTGSFGSLQVLPAWLKDFGHLDPATGKYSNPTSRTSIMNSVVFAGKLVGTMLFEPIAERLGYKYTMYITALIQFVALIIELTAKNWVVFTVGRIIAYLSVGIVENCVPSYISEISPAGVRGFMSGTMTVLVTVGNLWGAGMSRIFATETRRIGWIIPVAIQFLPALGILVLVPFTPESPRWLVSKGRTDEAIHSLNRVRPAHDVSNGLTVVEVQAFEAAIEDAQTMREGRWSDLFRGTFRRRAIITGLLFWFYQSTGVQFVNIYGPTGKMAFTYSVIAQACGIVATIVGIVVIDHFGRRPPIILGSFVCIIFNALIAGLGSKKNPSVTEGHAVIASTVMVLVGSKMFQCVSFLMASEIGGKSMRKKFMGYGTSVDVLSAFVFTFCLPYLLKKPGANLGPKVGWLIAGDSLFAFIFSVFYVPEIAGRSLEEMDELFEMRLWAWQFKNAETSGVGRRIAQLEAGHTTGDKMEMDEYIEDSKKLEKQRVEVGQRQS